MYVLIMQAYMLGAADGQSHILTRFMNLSDQDTASYNQLIEAIYRNNLENARQILDNNPGIINAQDNSGNTLLHDAVSNGQVDMIDLLLNRGANINAQNNNGLTPLYQAAWKGRADIIYKLLLRGALDFENQTEIERVINFARREFQEELTQLIRNVQVEMSYEYVLK